MSAATVITLGMGSFTSASLYEMLGYGDYGATPVPPTPTPTPVASTPGGIVSRSQGLFTGFNRPQQKKDVQTNKKLTRSQKRLQKSQSATPPTNKPYESAPNLQTVATAKSVAAEMRKLEKSRQAALLQANASLMALEASQLATQKYLAQQEFLRLQEEMAIILLLDDL